MEHDGNELTVRELRERSHSTITLQSLRHYWLTDAVLNRNTHLETDRNEQNKKRVINETRFKHRFTVICGVWRLCY